MCVSDDDDIIKNAGLKLMGQWKISAENLRKERYELRQLNIPKFDGLEKQI